MAPWWRRRPAVAVITDAAPSPADEQRHRQRLYTAIMAVHLAMFALSGVLYYTAWWLGLVMLIVTTPLPWIAVVLANDRGRRRADAARRARARERGSLPGARPASEVTDVPSPRPPRQHRAHPPDRDRPAHSPAPPCRIDP